MKKRLNACFLGIIIIFVMGLSAGCVYGGNLTNTPTPYPTPDILPTSTPYLQVSPGSQAVRSIEPAPVEFEATENAQSGQLEQAKAISAAARRILGVVDAAVVVTDDNKCVVALRLRSGTPLG